MYIPARNVDKVIQARARQQICHSVRATKLKIGVSNVRFWSFTYPKIWDLSQAFLPAGEERRLQHAAERLVALDRADWDNEHNQLSDDVADAEKEKQRVLSTKPVPAGGPKHRMLRNNLGMEISLSSVVIGSPPTGKDKTSEEEVVPDGSRYDGGKTLHQREIILRIGKHPLAFFVNQHSRPGALTMEQWPVQLIAGEGEVVTDEVKDCYDTYAVTK